MDVEVLLVTHGIELSSVLLVRSNLSANISVPRVLSIPNCYIIEPHGILFPGVARHGRGKIKLLST